jgi:hypothetical protein
MGIEAQPGPYLGIQPFGYAHRDRFFGRTREVEQLLAKLLTYRVVVLFGESGAGKSSVLNAGLIPALLRERFQAERLRIGPTASAPLILERIAQKPAGSPYLPSIFAVPDDSREKVTLSVGEFVADVERSNGVRPVLIIDQFEELFTRFADPDPNDSKSAQAQILTALLGLAESSDVAVKVLIVIREDYLAKLEPPARRFPQLSYNRVQLLPLTRSAARLAILQPFEQSDRWQSRLDPALADRILGDLAPGPDAVSSTQLQIVCARLWDTFASAKTAIVEDDYRKLGGFDGIVQDYLRKELNQADPAVRRAAVLALDRMVTASGTRDVVSQDNILQLVETPREDTQRALDLLEKWRLIDRTLERNTVYCEVANEYLIPAIRRETEAAKIDAAVSQARLERERQEEQLRQERIEARRTTAAKLRATYFAWIAALVATLAAGFAFEWYRASSEARQARRELLVSAAQLKDSEQARALQRGQLEAANARLQELEKGAAAVKSSATGGRGMFRTLDVLLGFAVFVLLVSFAGMLITHALVGLLGLRAKHLRRGLAEVLQRLDPPIPAGMAEDIGMEILRNRSVAGDEHKPGSVIFRDQFARVLLEIAAESEGTAVQSILARNGVPNAVEMLRQVEKNMARLALSYPELTESERQNLALASAGQNRFIAVLNERFDRAMDRVSDSFGREVRLWVFAVSLVFALIVQFDAFAVLNRMFIDPDTRVALIRAAATAAPEVDKLRLDATTRIFSAPASLPQWVSGWQNINPIGLVLSAILLAIGAQFWYNALKIVLGLRSVAEGREQEERAWRQMPREREAPSLAREPPSAVTGQAELR